jgi:hypothetical protein
MIISRFLPLSLHTTAFLNMTYTSAATICTLTVNKNSERCFDLKVNDSLVVLVSCLCILLAIQNIPFAPAFLPLYNLTSFPSRITVTQIAAHNYLATVTTCRPTSLPLYQTRTPWWQSKRLPLETLSTVSTASASPISSISAPSVPSASTPSPALTAQSAHSSESATYAFSLLSFSISKTYNLPGPLRLPFQPRVL